MAFFDTVSRHLLFVLAAVPVLAGAWIFGAWEAWWFWPFSLCIFAASGLLGLRLTLGCERGWQPGPMARWIAAAGVTWAAFLAYAMVRAAQARVYMDAERAFMLFLTPALLGLTIALGMTARRARLLVALAMGNLAAIGIYGIVNQHVTGGVWVLWLPGYPQYIVESRVTGTYFCPDHFAGLMEILFASAVAVLLAREPRWPARVGAAAAMGIAVVGVVMSKSRGGGLALAVVCGVALLVGFAQWRPAVRWGLRGALLAAVVLGGLAVAAFGQRYVERFRQYPWDRLEQSDRGQMIAGALRAWRDAPVLGIGPGMHQNLWPHYAASPDGDREKGIWPSRPNYTFHSYEVHSDWVQLLEELGVVGLLLFGAVVGAGLGVLEAARRRAVARQRADGRASGGYWCVLAALLAVAALGFHSLGDFNLQIPATTWNLAAVVAAATGWAARAGTSEGEQS